MNVVERIAQHLADPPVDADGETCELKCLPSVSAEDIAEIERRIGGPLSPEVRALLEYCGGFEGGTLEEVHFTGRPVDYCYPKSLRGRLRTLALDGWGNFWFFWSSDTSADLGPIYYYQHEGPMLFFQSRSLVEFVGEYLRFMKPPYASLLDDVHEFRIKPIRELNREAMTVASALAGSDSDLVEFARLLPADACVYDFRRANVGDGVDLKRMDVIAVHERLPILGLKSRSGWQRFIAFFVGRK